MYKTYKLREILTESKIVSEINDPNKRITVKLNVKGVKKRPLKNDVKGATKYFKRSKGQFIYGKQNLHKGAFGIIPESLDGYETTSDIPTFDINRKICNPQMLIYFFKQNDYYKQLEGLAKGVGSKRIHPAQIYDLEIILPSIEEQEDIIKKSLIKEYNLNKLFDINKKNQNYIKLLKQSILQEAIEGKLTKSWREKNRDVESASVLLKKIKAEKQELIKQKKLKKQKELNSIEKDEIPFDIPNNNILCRLGEVTQVNPRNKLDDDVDTSFIPMKLIKDGFVNEHISEKRKWKEIKKGFTHFKEKDVVFAKITPCFQNRKSVVMKNLINGYGAGTTELIVLRSFKETILPELLLYFVKSKSFIDLGVSTYTGTAGQQRVDREKLLNMLFLLPPLEEQKEIVKKVDELMVLCDELEKQTLEAKENSENLMKAVLGEVFSK